MLTLEQFKAARATLQGVIRTTSLIHSPALSKACGNQVYLKPENMQVTGAYKIRGAYYKISTLSEEEKARGLITASAGNHAQGVAYAAQAAGVPATIVMPTTTPLVKVNNTKDYGARVILHGEVFDEAAEKAAQLAEEEGLTYVHPFNDLGVATGQGTIAYEIFQDLPDVDVILVPIGGGGLISLPAYLFAGLPVHYTYGTNKFSAACGTTFATAQFFQKGAMNIRVGLLAAVGSFVGSALGSHIVLLLSDQVLRTMMLIILPVAAVLILWRRDLPDENRDDGTLNAKKAVLALAIGLGIGLYDGIFGPGTGTFAIIAFTTLMGFDLRTAGGNAKVLNLASNYASLVTYLSSGLVVFSIGIPCAISGIVGNLLGSHFALKNGAKFIRPMMLVVLVLLLGKIVSDAVL